MTTQNGNGSGGSPGGNALANTGSGGGGGGNNTSNGGKGGSGVFIISWNPSLVSITCGGTLTTNGSLNVCSYTTTGSSSFTVSAPVTAKPTLGFFRFFKRF